MRVLERRPSDAFEGLAGGARDGRRDAARDAGRRLRGRGDRVQPRRRAVLRREGRGAPAGGERRRPGEPAGRGAAGRERARGAGLERRRGGLHRGPRATAERGLAVPGGRLAATATPARKRLGEEIALRAAADGQDVVVACPGFLLGARRRQPHQHLRRRGVPARRSAHHGRGRHLVRRRARRRRRAAGRRAPGRERASLHPHERGRQPQPSRVLRARGRGRRQAPPHVRAAAGAARRRRAHRACAAAAGAAESRGDRGRVPLLVLHAGPGDGRARLPAAPVREAMEATVRYLRDRGLAGAEECRGATAGWPRCGRSCGQRCRRRRRGCSSSGAGRSAASSRGCERAATRPSASTATHRPGEGFHQVDFERYDPPRAVDAIVASRSLHHVDDPAGVADRHRGGPAPRRGDRGRRMGLGALRREDRALVLRAPRTGGSGRGSRLAAAPPRRAGSPPERRWDAYFTSWAASHGIHRAERILRELDGRFERSVVRVRARTSSPSSATIAEADEQAAIDAGEIRATGIRYVGRGR